MSTHHPHQHRIGAILWVASVQYYILQLLVAASWAKDTGYSWANNTISDLANTHCGPYGDRLVCSPLHTAMNISFIFLGITMASGAVLLRKQLAASRQSLIGFDFIGLAGTGTILVGLFPENTISSLHITGAALTFIFGNLAMILLGTDLKGLPISMRVYTILSGAVGLGALLLFEIKDYMGIGNGGMERLVGYPQSIWMIVLGVYLLISNYSTRAKQ